MSENQKNPVEAPAAERTAAIQELRRVERARNDCLSRWASMREQLGKGEVQIALTRKFEVETTSLHLLDGRLEECKRRVREANVKVRQAMLRWTLRSSMESSRARSHAA